MILVSVVCNILIGSCRESNIGNDRFLRKNTADKLFISIFGYEDTARGIGIVRGSDGKIKYCGRIIGIAAFVGIDVGIEHVCIILAEIKFNDSAAGLDGGNVARKLRAEHNGCVAQDPDGGYRICRTSIVSRSVSYGGLNESRFVRALSIEVHSLPAITVGAVFDLIAEFGNTRNLDNGHNGSFVECIGDTVG